MIIEVLQNELDRKFMVDMVLVVLNTLIGLVALGYGIFFDTVALRFAIQHQEGFGAGQIIWCSFWALYLVGIFCWAKMTRTYWTHYGM